MEAEGNRVFDQEESCGDCGARIRISGSRSGADRLSDRVSYIGGYLVALTDAEAELRSGSLKILNWDFSSQVKEYVKQALIAKYVAQCIAFVILPLGLFVWRASTFGAWGVAKLAEVAWNVVFLAVIGFVILKSFQRRRSAYLVTGRTILARTTSTPGQ